MMRIIVVAAVFIASSTSAEIKLNLKHLGNKAASSASQQSNAEKPVENEFGLIEQEMVSGTSYSSDGNQIGLRSNVELVKPGKQQLNGLGEYPGLIVEDNVQAAPKANPINKLSLKLAKPTNPKSDDKPVSADKPALKVAQKPEASKPVVSSSSGEQNSILASIDKALGIKPVRSWEKGTLAKKEMKPGGTVPEFDLFSEKVFSYKQGSVGGSGVGGGGCGCN